MIRDFRHKGLEKFFLTGTTVGIETKHSQKLPMQLAMLNAATEIDDMDKPAWSLHPLKGNRKGIWSVKVCGNWRITFKLEKGDAHVVNYEDYH